MDGRLAKGSGKVSMLIIDEKPLILNRWVRRRRLRPISREAAGGGAQVDTTRE